MLIMIEIKDKNGELKLSTVIGEGSIRRCTLMKEDYVTLVFSTDEPVYFKLGDGIDNEWGMFELVDLYSPTYNESTGGYDYQLRLDAYYWKWKNKIFKYTPENHGQEASWSLTATLDVHLGVFLRNLQALGYKYRNTPFSFEIGNTVENTSQLITYENTNLIDALNMMAETWDCEWWVTDSVIHFGKCEYGDPVKLELGVEVETMTREGNNQKFATRIYAFGSTNNIPSDYRPVDESVVVNGVVQKRLMLPEGTPYLDAYENMTQEEAVEDVVIFDDVYPRRIGTLSGITTQEYTDTIENEDGTETEEKWLAYRFKDAGINFSKEYILPGQELQITFQSGKLNGLTFGVIFNPTLEGEEEKPEKLPDGSWNPEAQLWEIVRNEDYGRPLPGGELIPANGDTYYLTGFNIKLVSDQYIPAAEEELEEEAQQCLDKTQTDPNTYICTLRPDYVYNKDMEEEVVLRTFELGDKINLVNPTFFSNGRVSRVIGYERKLDIPYDHPVYFVGEVASTSRIGELEDKVDALTYKGQTFTGNGSGVYVVGRYDSTPLSDRNVLSSLKAISTFLRKDMADSTPYILRLLAGSYFGKYIEGQTGGKIDANGIAEFLNIILRGDLKSINFSTGALGSGYALQIDENGDSYLEIDRLLVRKIAYFVELVIQRMSHVGGQIVLTPASMKCVKVEEHDDYYRCYFESTDGDKEITNDFVVGDQARCQTFNIKAGTSQNVSNSYYWRLVVGVGDDYIDLSKTDCDAGSTVPQADDEIVLLGNRTDATRQAAIVLAAYGEDAPYIKLYRGINSYQLSGKEFISFSRTQIKMIADELYFSTGESVSTVINGVKSDLEETKTEFQGKIDTVSQSVNSGKLYVKGTGYNVGGAAANPQRQVILNGNGINIADPISRGMNLITLDRSTLDVVDNAVYDYGGSGVDEFVEKLNGLSDDVIVILASKDSFFCEGDYLTKVIEATSRCGGSGNPDAFYSRIPYALVGIPGIGKGAGIEMFTSSLNTAPAAEISTQIINGVPVGINGAAVTAIGNLKIGVRNLASKTKITNNAGATINGYEYTFSAQNTDGLTLNKDIFELNEEYVLSFRMRVNSGTLVNIGGHQVGFIVNNFEINGTKPGGIWNGGIEGGLDTENLIIAHVRKTSDEGNIGLWIQPNRMAGTLVNVTISEISVVKGNKYVGWSPAPEDLEAAAQEAKDLADAAQAAADAADAKADSAKEAADAAKDRLDDWAADSVISPTEKQGLKDEIARIDGDKSEITANYTKYGLGTPTAYNSAHSAYRAVLVTLSASTPETITIPSDFATKQSAYYTARTNALTAIAEKAKQVADAAQTAADNAQTAADNALDKYNNLKIGVKNLVSFKHMLSWNEKAPNKDIAIWGQDSDGVYLGINGWQLFEIVVGGNDNLHDIFLGEGNYKANTQYVLSVEWKLAGAQDYQGLMFYIEYTDGSRDFTRINKDQTTLIRADVVTAKGKTIQKIYSSYGTNAYRTLIYALSLVEGNVIPLEIPTAEEDIWRSEVNLVDGGEEVTLPVVTSGEYNYKELIVPVLKPNTVYTVSVEGIEVLAGNPEVFEATIYFQSPWLKVANWLTLSSGKKYGLLITTNDFSAGEGVLLLYAGIAGATAGNSVRYTGISLVEGFYPPTMWRPSNGDINNEIQDVSNALTSLGDEINGAFKDGIINEAETKAIGANINVLNAEKKDIDAQYTELYGNTYLTGTAKTNLQSAKTAYNTAHTNLINAINTAISDGIATATEKTDIDNKFTAYGTALGTYRTRAEEANKAIQDEIKRQADEAAQEKVDNLQIGVRNLLLKSNVEKSNANYSMGSYVFSEKPVKGKEYTLTLCYTLGENNTFIGAYPTNGSSHADFKKKGEKVVEQKTFTIREDVTVHSTLGFYQFPNGTFGSKVHWAVLVEGNKAPNMWVAAPEDIQAEVEAAQQAASDAQEAANAAQSDATEAKTELNQINSDSVISPVEKTALKQQQADIQAEYNEIIADAGRYSISTTAYKNAYTSANNALTKYTATSPTYITVGSDYANIAAYYDARQTILNSIAAAAKKASDDAMQAAEDEAELAKWRAIGYSWNSGKPLWTDDPTFKEGNNYLEVYRGATLVREAKQAYSPVNDSEYNMKIVSSGEDTGFGNGGFCRAVNTRANAVYVFRIIAKLPKGSKLTSQYNDFGDAATRKMLWVTSTEGTGNFEEYILVVRCGATGTFPSIGFFSIKSGTLPATWYLAYAGAFDVTAGVSTGEQLQTVSGTVTTLSSELTNTKEAFESYKDEVEVKFTASATATEEQIENAVTNLQIGIRNLLLKSNVEKSNANYSMGSYVFSEKPVKGKEYTLTLCYTLGENNTFIGAYPTNGSSHADFKKKGEKVVEQKTFTIREDVTVHSTLGFYQFPNGTFGSKVHWAVLVEGNKAPNMWVAAPEDLDLEINSVKQSVSAIEQTAENISLRVTTTETKVTTAQNTADAAQTAANNASTKADTNLTAAKNYADDKKQEAINTAAADATSKANDALADAKADATTKANNALASAKADATTKANNALASAKTDAQNKADAALSSAKSYADTKDSSTLESAKNYAESEAAGALSDAKDYTDGRTKPMWKGWIDATGLDEDKYYPVTITIPSSRKTTIEVYQSLSYNCKPSWSTHNGGFSLKCIWEVIGSGWGTNPNLGRQVLDYSKGFTANETVTIDGESVMRAVHPVGTIRQIGQANMEYIYVRGGGQYYFTVINANESTVPVLHTSDYTWTRGSISVTLKVLTSAEITPIEITGVTKTELKSEIEVLEDAINLRVTKTDYDANNVALNNQIGQLETSYNSINGTVSSLNTRLGVLEESGFIVQDDFVTLFSQQLSESGDLIASYLNLTPDKVTLGTDTLEFNADKVKFVSENGLIKLFDGTNVINVNNGKFLVKNTGELNINNGVFKVTNTGAMTATSGTIGGFTIGSSYIGAAGNVESKNGFSLYRSFLKFRDTDHYVAIGLSTFASSTAYTPIGRFENTEVKGATESQDNVCLYLNATGCPETYQDAGKNYAIWIEKGHIYLKSGYIRTGALISNSFGYYSGGTVTPSKTSLLITFSNDITLSGSGVGNGHIIICVNTSSSERNIYGTVFGKVPVSSHRAMLLVYYNGWYAQSDKG